MDDYKIWELRDNDQKWDFCLRSTTTPTFTCNFANEVKERKKEVCQFVFDSS